MGAPGGEGRLLEQLIGKGRPKEQVILKGKFAGGMSGREVLPDEGRARPGDRRRKTLACWVVTHGWGTLFLVHNLIPKSQHFTPGVSQQVNVFGCCAYTQGPATG